MDILPVVSRYGFKKNNNPIINKTLDVQLSNLNRSANNIINNNITLDTVISNLNRKFQSVDENVKILDPVVYTKNLKGVELNRQDNLNVSTKNLIPEVEPINYSFWSFPNPSGITISNFKMSFDPSETVQVDWGDGSVETIVSDTNYDHTYL
jgi:hypothetical protein